MTVLRTQYDVLLLDLDGTLYAGAHAIPGTQVALGQGTQALYYVTNNASRSPSAVSAHLTELGFDSEDDRVVTSSQTAVRLLAERLEPGAAVLVVGTDALADEVTRVGLLPVREFADSPVAVVQGHSTETDWTILAEACLAIRRVRCGWLRTWTPHCRRNGVWFSETARWWQLYALRPSRNPWWQVSRLHR
ncbi:hypothetical protein GCM10020255_084170 [Rhodococcus baikonurensis]